MDKNLLVEKYFTKKSTVKMITSYIMYYQISLSNYLLEATQNIEKTIKKVKELNLTLEPNKVILIVFDLIKTYKDEEDFDLKLEHYLKTKAMLHALNDLSINENELQWDGFKEYKITQILEEVAFDKNMQRQYLLEYVEMHKYYDNVLTDEDISEIQNVLVRS